MKKLIFTALLITSLAFNTQAQDADPYKDTLKEMLVASGSMGTFQVAIKQVFNMYKQQKPGVPDEVWEELQSSFSKTSIDDLAEMLTPVYKKNLTQSDLQALISTRPKRSSLSVIGFLVPHFSSVNKWVLTK